MIKKVSNKVIKETFVVILAVVMTFIGGVSSTAYAITSFVDKILVFSQPMHGGEGISQDYFPTKVYTIPEGDIKLSIGIKVETYMGDPTSTHAVLQQKGIFGWKSIASAWIATDVDAQTPFGLMNVKPGEQYRLICSCTPNFDQNSAIYVTVAFVSQY